MSGGRCERHSLASSCSRKSASARRWPGAGLPEGLQRPWKAPPPLARAITPVGLRKGFRVPQAGCGQVAVQEPAPGLLDDLLPQIQGDSADEELPAGVGPPVELRDPLTGLPCRPWLPGLWPGVLLEGF